LDYNYNYNYNYPEREREGERERFNFPFNSFNEKNLYENNNNNIYNPFGKSQLENYSISQCVLENQQQRQYCHLINKNQFNFEFYNPLLKGIFNNFDIDNSSHKISEEIQKNLSKINLKGKDNPLLAILNSLVLSFIFFCGLILRNVRKYINLNEALFLDSLIKYVIFLFNFYFNFYFNFF
jgi:hypothetical protein